MNKKLIIVVSIVAVLALVVGGYYYSKMQVKTPEQQAVIQDTSTVPEGVLPTINTGATNPLENAQTANPYNKTNPFTNIKTNPFQ